MHENACAQRGHHGVRQSTRGQKHRKGHTPGQTNVYQLKTADEKKETYEEAKRDKEKN
jgi:hypothetical protein